MHSQLYDAPRWAASKAVQVHTVHRASPDKENLEGKQERYSRNSSKISVGKTGIQNLYKELAEKRLHWCDHVKKKYEIKNGLELKFKGKDKTLIEDIRMC